MHRQDSVYNFEEEKGPACEKLRGVPVTKHGHPCFDSYPSLEIVLDMPRQSAAQTLLSNRIWHAEHLDSGRLRVHFSQDCAQGANKDKSPETKTKAVVLPGAPRRAQARPALAAPIKT